MSPTLTTFLFELANFLLLVAAIGWLLFRPVRAALAARQTAEEQRRDELRAREAALATARSELDARQTAFDAETARLRAERIEAAEAEASGIVSRAREEAGRERDRQHRMLGHLERAEIERLSTAVAFATRESIGRLLTTLQTPELDQALVRAACRQLEGGPSSLGDVLVESAAPLDESARTALTSAAGARATALSFRVVPDLGAGLRVTTAAGLVDASSAGIAAYAGRVLAERLTTPDEQEPDR